MTHAQVNGRSLWPARLSTVLACASSVLLMPRLASADPASSESNSPQAQYRQAHNAMNAKNWDEARRLLFDLWTRSQTYDVASDLMFVEYHLGHFASAANYGEFAIRNVPPVADAEESSRVKKGLDEVKKRVGALSIVVNTPGADIQVDSVAVGKSPLLANVYVDVGPHIVSARSGAAASPETRVDALAGEIYKVELTLPEASTAESAPPPVAPAAANNAPERDQPQRANYTPAIVAASVGGVALVGGIAALIVSINKHSDAQDRLAKLQDPNACGPGMSPSNAQECSKIADQADSSHTFRTLSFVGFGTAIAAGAMTYVLWPKSHAGMGKLTPRLDVSRQGFLAAAGYDF
jgi:hypothetical protein